jgi:hypothetical protein
VIEPLFKPFSRVPDPVGYQPMIDDLSAAMHDLSGGHVDQDPIDKNPYLANPTLEKIHTASDYLQDWSGQAAMQFKQKFLDPFPAVSANQFILTAILKAALEAHQAMAPLLLSVVGAAAQVGAVSPPDNLSDPPKGGGETALQIINSMKVAIDRLTQAVQWAEAFIAQKITTVTDLIARDRPCFVSARPALASVPETEITGSSGVGDSN